MRLNLRFAFSSIAIPYDNLENLNIWHIYSQVDLTEYVEKHEFVFDAVLDEDVSNDEVCAYCKLFALSGSIVHPFSVLFLSNLQVYRETVEPVVPAIFNRTKATCFAYGQTGTCPIFSISYIHRTLGII